MRGHSRQNSTSSVVSATSMEIGTITRRIYSGNSTADQHSMWIFTRLQSRGKLRRVKLRRSSQLWRKLIRGSIRHCWWFVEWSVRLWFTLLIYIISENQLSWEVPEMSPSHSGSRVSGLKVAKPLSSLYLPANLAGLSWETSQVWTWTQKKNLGSTGILKTIIIIKIHNNVNQLQQFKGNRRSQQ